MHKVTVVIPLYNKAAFIERALNSVLGQTYTDFRVLVIDDGSTDDGASVVKKFTDSRVELISQPNLGPGAARNKGLFLSDDEYITFLDADDEWMPGFLEQTVALMKSYDKEVAAVSCYLLYPPFLESNKQMWVKSGLREGICRLNPKTPAETMVALIAYASPCATLARTSVLKENGGFYDKDRCVYGEDAHLWVKVALQHSMAVSFEPMVKYHTEDSNLAYFHLQGPHPVEPFLVDSSEFRDICPAELLPLLDQFLAIRAYKTAKSMGLWGRWGVSKKLLKDFGSIKYCRLPGYWVAHLSTTPMLYLIRNLVRILHGKEPIKR